MVTRTGVTKTFQGWNYTGQYRSAYLQVGDAVDSAMRSDFVGVVFPICYTSDLIQIGEPMDHEGKKGRARYMTIQRDGSDWIYTGLQEAGAKVEIVPW